MGWEGATTSKLVVDGTTLAYNANGQLEIKSIPNSKKAHATVTKIITVDLTYSANATLTSDVFVEGNITINSGITITTNGYNFYCTGAFTNNGTINVGTSNNNSATANVSYGGSGGSGSAGQGGTGGTATSGAGASTYAAGGAAVSENSGSSVISGNNGATPTAPTLSNSVISGFYSTGFSIVLSGGGGGTSIATANNSPATGNSATTSVGASGYASGGSGDSITAGANGSYGLYIQANKIIAGTINANGVGSNGGASGGGSLLLAYGAGGYTAGTYNVSGGAGTDTFNGSPAYSGNGGSGLVMTYNYTTPPITLSAITITPIATGNVSIRMNAVKNGTTLGSEISTITLTNITTGNSFSIDLIDGVSTNGELGTESGLTLNTAYQYLITTLNDTTGIYATLAIDEVA